MVLFAGLKLGESCEPGSSPDGMEWFMLVESKTQLLRLVCINPAATVVWVLKRRKRLFYMAASSSVAKRVLIMNLFPSPPDEETL